MRYHNDRVRRGQWQPDLMLFRLLAAYLICLILYLHHEKIYFTDFEFFKNVSLPILLAGTMLVFLFLNLVKNRRVIYLLNLCLLTLYGFLAISENRTSAFLFGCISCMAFFIFFTRITDFKLKLPDWYVWTAAVVLMLLVCLFVSVTCIMTYEENGTSCFDFGIFSQMFHYLKKCGLPLTSCERDGLLSHFAVHISPVFYLLLPIYALFPDPRTLLVMQCVVTFSGVIPWILLCRKHHISNTVTLAFSIIYLLYPSFTGSCYYNIHENNFLPPLILWLLLFLERDAADSGFYIHKILCIVSAVLVLGVKEDAAVYVAVIALYFLLLSIKCVYKEKKKWITLLKNPSLWIFILSIAYFVMAVVYLSTKGDGAMTGRYDNYIYDGSGSLFVMLLGILKNPIYVVSQCVSTEKLTFLAYMLLPLGLLPLCCRKMERWILMIPLLLFNLMTAYTYQYSIYYQYAFGSGVLLIYLAMINYEDMGVSKQALSMKDYEEVGVVKQALSMKDYKDVDIDKQELSMNHKKNPAVNDFRKKMLVFSIVSAVLIYGFHFGQKTHYYKDVYVPGKEYRESVKEALELIPDDASVAAGTYLVPVLSQRDVIYELDTTNQKAEYYVLDLRGNDNSAMYDNDPYYEQLYYSEGEIAVYRYTEATVIIQ